MSAARVKVVGTGLYVPSGVETAAEVAGRIGKSEEWIRLRTAVAERRIADRPLEQMAAEAGREALGDGGPPDLVIYASASTRQLLPDTSVFVLRELGLEGIPSYSMHATCLSFFVALRAAASLIETGVHRRVLIVSAEQAALVRNDAEPESAALLGDGAAAAVLEATPEGEQSALLGWGMEVLPQGAELTEVRGMGMNKHPNDPATTPEDNLFHMDGPAVLLMARQPVVDLVWKVGLGAGLTGPDDVDLVVPHQASGRAIKALMRHSDNAIPEDRYVVVVDRYGNTAAASMPMALAHANREGRIRRGDRVLLVGTGAGLSVGAAILRW